MTLAGLYTGVRALLRKDSAALMSANLAAALMGLVTGVVSARALGAEGRGDLAVIIFWPSLLATLVDLGIADAVTLRTAREPGAFRRHAMAGLVISLAGSALGVLLGFVGLPLLLRSGQGQLLAQSRWALLYIPLSLLAAVPAGSLLGLREFRAVAWIRIGSALAYLVAMVGAVLLGWGTVPVLVALTVASRFLPFPLSLPWIVGRWWRAPGADWSVVDQAKDGARLQGARLASVLSGAEDRALASLRLGQAEIGYWQVASALTYVMPFVPQAFAQQLYALTAAGGPGQRELVVRFYVRSMVLTALTALAAAPLLPFVIPLLYGSAFSASVLPAILVAAAAIPAAGAMTLQAAARGLMRTRSCIESEVAGIAVMATMGWPLSRAWGQVGLAVAYLAGRSAAAAWMAWAMRPLFGVELRELWPGSATFRSTAREDWRRLVGHFHTR